MNYRTVSENFFRQMELRQELAQIDEQILTEARSVVRNGTGSLTFEEQTHLYHMLGDLCSRCARIERNQETFDLINEVRAALSSQ